MVALILSCIKVLYHHTMHAMGIYYIYGFNTVFYPAMTAFTDQYSLPNIFFDIGQL